MSDSVRLDKWLWAARFFKTRSLAADAVDTGKVEIGGVRPKASRAVRVGDVLSIRRGPYTMVVEVLGVSAKRGAAKVAAGLYEESAESVAAREELAAALKIERAAQVRFEGRGRPTKKARRELVKLAARSMTSPPKPRD